MPGSWASVDGRIVPIGAAVVPATDPAVTLGWSVFETAEVQDGVVPLIDRHLERLADSAVVARVPLPDPSVLEAWVVALAAHHGGPGRLRILVSASGLTVITVLPLDPARRGAPVRCVRGPHVDEPFLGGAVKHGSRAPWAVAVQCAGVDDVLRVDGEGRFTEGTMAAIVAVVDGEVWTAPDDGRVLPSTTVAELVERAAALDIVVRREGPFASGPWQGLYVASATRGLAPVVELDGVALPGWEPVGLQLAAAWRVHGAERSGGPPR